MNSKETDYVESVVCKVGDLDNEDGKEFMKEVEIGDGKCLVIRHNTGEITAIGHKCVHYGAPLIKGVLKNGRVRCPWHGACFDGKTGDIEDFPGLDSLHKFEVMVKDDDVIVKARKTNLVNNKRNVLAGKQCKPPSDGPCEKVVIIGGGPSSLTCAETLRKEGYAGRVIIVSKDAHPPYDRPKLSKALNIEPEAAYLRPLDFYNDVGIELVLDTEVIAVDVVSKRVRLNKKSEVCDDDAWLGYNKLVIATGGTPRTLKPTAGWDLENVFVLRTPEDANAISTACKGKKVVVIGSSFIGMEVASFLAAKEIPSSIAVVCGKRSKVPFQGSLGEIIGGMVMKMHEEKGVKFYPSAGVTALKSAQGGKAVESVTLSDGSIVEADVVVVGIGVTPATEFLTDSEIKLNDRGLILVDGHMLSKIPNIYAVGDIAYFPLRMKDGGELANIQHWQMAHAHGRIAALDIIQRAKNGQKPSLSSTKHARPVNSIPFFWTVQYGKSIRFTGHCPGYDDLVVRGNVEEQKFAAYYVKDDKIVAIATLGSDPLAADMAERFIAGENVTRKDIPNLNE